MKIAVTSQAGSMDALLSERFGRCPYFVIYDTESAKFNVITNIGEQMKGGAGPKAAELVIKEDAQVLLTGKVGNKAKDVLDRANLKVIDGFGEAISVRVALEEYLNNKIK